MQKSQERPASLAAKLLEVARAISHVEKRGRNEHHRYDYVQAVDVVSTVRKELHDRGVVVLPRTIPGSVRHHTETGGRGFVTTVDLEYEFRDAETGESVVLTWTGAGADTGGDKGLYKAFTGGLKYALIQAFLIPMGEDPESDRVTEGKQHRDAARPPAPRIPADRARYLLEAAQAAGLADGTKLGPVLKAKLMELGATDANGEPRLGALDVDSAEALEAFIRQEEAA